MRQHHRACGTEPAKELGTMDKRTCSVEGCEEPHSGRGYCARHYQRWHRWGDPLASGTEHVPGRGCAFDGCGKPHDSHGYCASHAKQLRDGKALHLLRPVYNGASCTVAGCEKPAVARGYCPNHWATWRKYGDPLVSMQQVKGICGFPGCERPHDSHGYCISHARQFRQGREVRELESRTAWSQRARQNVEGQIARRRYALDEAYFDEISDERRAYWLGFIAADGGITTGKANVLRVELAAYDEAHLERMRSDLGSDRPLGYYESCACASFGSRYLVAALGRLGITPRKSATVQPWDGPADLMPHYWRGLFDGDGSIYKVSTRSDWCLSICGSRACVEGFAEWARGISGGTARPRQIRDTACWMWAVTGGRKPQALASALYAGAVVALERKCQLAAELCGIDFAATAREANERRAAAMRDAWRSGRHPRSAVART